MTKVLLVEDDNNLREIYEARLTAEGYEISSAQDGEEALVVAKQAKPDLVISDVMMPKISGFEMLDILRNTPGLEHVKVIMLTALGQSEDRDRAGSLGADKYLVKSQVTLEDIVKTARQMLGDEEPADSAAEASEPATAPENIAVEPAPSPAPIIDDPVAAAPLESAAEPTPVEPPAEPAPPEQTTAAPEAPAEPPVAPEEPVTPPIEPTAPAQDNDKTVAAAVEPEPSVTSTPASEPTIQPVSDTPAEPQAAASSTEPVTTASQTATEAVDGSTAQEEALITQQIEEFVDHIETTEAAQPPTAGDAVVTPTTTPPSESTLVEPTTTAAPMPEPAEATPANSTTESAPMVQPEPTLDTNDTVVSSPDDASVADDQLMADAVDQLASTSPDAQEEPVNQPNQIVSPEPVAATEPAPVEPSEDTAVKANISITGKKVIQPLNSEPKPDINELLAREEATSPTEASTAPAVVSSDETSPTGPDSTETPAVLHQPGQSFAPQPETPPASNDEEKSSNSPVVPPSQKDDFDPNSIAL